MRPESALRPYQNDAIDHLYAHDGGLSLVKMGGGKTVIAATAANALVQDGHARRVLVLAPKRVCLHVWATEFAEWEHLAHIKPAIALGTPAQRRAAFTADFVVINYDNVVWMIDEGLHEGFDILILDESSKMKNSRSKRFRALARELRKFKIRWDLTGTFTGNKAIADIYGQVYCVDRGRRLGRTFTGFRQQYYTYVGPNQWDWEPKNSALTDVLDKISDIAMVVETYEGLPPIVHNDIKVYLPDRVMQMYAELEATYVAELDAGMLTAANAGVLRGKLHQIADGFLYTDPDGGFEWLHDAKLDALEEIIDQQGGEPLLVPFFFKAQLTKLRERWNWPYVGGGASDANAARAIQQWMAGDLDGMFIHPASAGHGLNLQGGGHTLAWAGFTESADDTDQTEARLRRMGQTAADVWSNRLVAADTVDEDIVHAVTHHLSTRDAVEKGIKERRSR